MKKSKKVQVWWAAELVHEKLRIQSNCFDYSGQVIKSRVIVCIDDDPWSAVWASWLFHKMLGQGSAPVVLCVGGQGLLSRHTDNKELKAELEKMLGQKIGIFTEARRLQYVCLSLGVFPRNLYVLDKGTNTGANIGEIAEFLVEHPEVSESITFALTPRLSLRFERSFKFQIQEAMRKACAKIGKTVADDFRLPEDRYFVGGQALSNACSWANGKKCCNGEMMLHELASILDRCDRYAGKFQLPLEQPVDEETRKAAALLASRYRIKLGKMGIREIMQYLRLFVSLKKHQREMVEELKQIIRMKRREFEKEFGICFIR